MTSFDHMNFFRQKYNGYSQIMMHQNNLIYAWDLNKFVFHNPYEKTTKTYGYKID